MQGESLISTKAITCLVDNLNVNPIYIFTGKGEMFLTDESEVESLRKERSEWERKFFAVQDEFFKSQAELEKAVLRYNRLIDITSIAMEKTQKSKETEE